MPLLELTWAHDGHFAAHVKAPMVLSAASERHWVTQGGQKSPFSVVNLGKCERFAAEAGSSGGGGGFASELCKEFVLSIQHALQPLGRCGG